MSSCDISYLEAQAVIARTGATTHRASARRAALRVTPLQLVVLGACGAAIALTGVYISTLVAGVLYAVGYVMLTWVRPDLALLVMFAASPFPYDIGGGGVHMAISDVCLVLSTPIFVIRAAHRGYLMPKSPISWPVMTYLGVCVASCARNGMSVDGIISVVQMGVYLVLAVNLFSSCIQDPRERIAGFTGLLLSTGFLSVLAVATRQSYPLGIHKNAVGANLAYGLIVCTELMLAARSVWRKRLLRVLALVLIGGLFFSLSRGAWISAVLGVAIVMGMRKEFGLFLRGSVVTGVVIAMAWAVLPKHEQLYAVDMSPRTNSVNARLVSIDYAMHYFETSPLLGVGVGLRKEYDATNIVMSTLAETGVIGLITFGSIFLSLIWKVFNSRKHIQVRQSEFSFVVVGTALVMVELAHGVVDHYWVRGMLPVWAAVGLAIQSVDRCRRECARQY